MSGDYYDHVFGLFLGVHFAWPSFDFNLDKSFSPEFYYDFLDMWGEISFLLPSEFLVISKTMTAATLGFGLVKIVVSGGTALAADTLQLLPDSWELVGGENLSIASGSRNTDVKQFFEAIMEDNGDKVQEMIELGGVVLVKQVNSSECARG